VTIFEAGLEQTPKHETLRNIEAGYVLRNNRISLQANVYYMDYKNQLVQTGKLNDVGAYTRTNIPKSYRAGVELQGSARLNNVLSLARERGLQPEQGERLHGLYRQL